MTAPIPIIVATRGADAGNRFTLNRIILGTMTTEEHQLMVLMLARMNQAVSAVWEALKSREVVTLDDQKAFYFSATDDNRQIAQAVLQARSDYLKIAKQAGVEVPPEI
jgi:hypothetical protein